jgi:hypothetical protein
MRYLPLLLLFLLAACTGTQEPDDSMVPPDASRQAELTRLYDRMGHETESTGVSAAETAAKGDERDQRFLASLWGTRKKSAVGARRLGTALRYDMASEYHALGRNEDCINLLANRMGTLPLPRELKSKYDDLISAASKG